MSQYDKSKMSGLSRKLVKPLQCIYCFAQKSDKTSRFNREHVFPKCITGNTANAPVLHGMVCENCNDYFGNNLDKLVTLEMLRPILAISFGVDISQGAPWIHPDTGITIESANDAIANRSRAKIEYEDGLFSICAMPQLAVLRHGDANWTHIVKRKLFWYRNKLDFTQLGQRAIVIRGDESIDRAIADLEERGFIIEAPFTSARLEELNRAAEITMLQYFRRALAKVAINYLAWLGRYDDPHILFDPEFDEIRDFVRNGIGDGSSFVTLQICCDASRKSSSHKVEVVSNSSNDVTVKLSLFNQLICMVQATSCPSLKLIIQRRYGQHHYQAHG